MILPRRLSSGAFLLLTIAFNVVGCYGNAAGNDATHINKKGGGYWGVGVGGCPFDRWCGNQFFLMQEVCT